MGKPDAKLMSKGKPHRGKFDELYEKAIELVEND